jgi:glutamyl-tRNA synthetase
LEERREWYLSLVDLLKTRARTMPGLVDLARPFLVDELEFDPEAVAKYWLKAPDLVLEQLTVLRARLEGSAWEPEVLEEVIRGYAEELSVGAGKIIHPLRVAVTGREVSPGIFDVLAFLGRRTVLSRLDDAIARLEDS